MAPQQPIAAIDIGTNSIHMVVARRLEGGASEVLAREKEPVRLGRGGTDMKRLEPAAIDRTVAALDRFRRIAEAHDATIVAVATSAVRDGRRATLWVPLQVSLESRGAFSKRRFSSNSSRMGAMVSDPMNKVS